MTATQVGSCASPSNSFSVFVDRKRKQAISNLRQSSDATLKINGRTYTIEKLLGEGGFAFVYLVRDDSGRRFALKKLLVTAEGVKNAMREVDAYRRFKHPNIIRVFDSAVVQDDTGEGKIVYLWVGQRASSAQRRFLPYFSRGNLQDAINTANISGTRLPEQRLLELFRDTCLA